MRHTDNGKPPSIPQPKLKGVTPALAESIKALPIPELVPFSACGPNEALKQISFAQGMLYVKRLIAQSLEAERVKDATTETTFPQ